MEDIQFYRHQALEVSQVDINVLFKLWRTATLTAHTTCSKQKHQTECTSQKKDYMLLKPESAGICLRTHSINPDKINNLMTLLGKKGIEVRVQKIKKSLKACTSFSRKTNIVRFIVNHVEIYTLFGCIPQNWRSDVPGGG